jgi:hypothetical protein
MVKHKSQRALYEILTKERQEGGPPVGGAKPVPIIRRPVVAEPAAPVPPAPPSVPREAPGPVVRMVPERAPVVIAGAPLTYFHLAIAALVVVGLCVLFYFLGGLFKGESGLPVTEKHPTIPEIQRGPPRPGLIVPGIERPGPGGILGQQPGGKQAGPLPGGAERPGGIVGRPLPGGAEKPGGVKAGPTPGGTKKPGGIERLPGPGPEPAPGGAEKPGGTEKTTTHTAPRYRIRIATFDIGQPNAVDNLRDFLQKNGIETEDVPARGAHILYSLEKFTDKKQADELLAGVKKQLEAFEKQTHRRTSKDAYVEQVKE